MSQFQYTHLVSRVQTKAEQPLCRPQSHRLAVPGRQSQSPVGSPGPSGFVQPGPGGRGGATLPPPGRRPVGRHEPEGFRCCGFAMPGESDARELAALIYTTGGESMRVSRSSGSCHQRHAGPRLGVTRSFRSDVIGRMPNIALWYRVVWCLMSMGSYTIGQLASAAGVPTTTVRYYERRGLLAPEARSASRYRLYREASLEQLRFIKAAQSAGFTLSDIESLLALRDDKRAPQQEVRGLIDERLQGVAKQIKDLKAVEKALRKWRCRCEQTDGTGRCGVIEGLESPGPGESE